MLLVGPAGSTVKIRPVEEKRVAFKAFEEFKLFLIFVKRQSSICQLTSVFNRETISLRGLVIVELMKTSHKRENTYLLESKVFLSPVTTPYNRCRQNPIGKLLTSLKSNHYFLTFCTKHDCQLVCSFGSKRAVKYTNVELCSECRSK